MRAYTHADDGDFDSAIAEAHDAFSRSTRSVASAHYILGIIYQRQGDQDAALRRSSERSTSTATSCSRISIWRTSTSREVELDDACREYHNTLTALEPAPDGSWTAFLGGFQTDLLAQTCERSLIECRKGSSRS